MKKVMIQIYYTVLFPSIIHQIHGIIYHTSWDLRTWFMTWVKRNSKLCRRLVSEQSSITKFTSCREWHKTIGWLIDDTNTRKNKQTSHTDLRYVCSCYGLVRDSHEKQTLPGKVLQSVSEEKSSSLFFSLATCIYCYLVTRHLGHAVHPKLLKLH